MTLATPADAPTLDGLDAGWLDLVSCQTAFKEVDQISGV
jgi:hypothetical protein